MTDEYDKAAVEARERGMAFMVDGVHVPADRVMILSVPDTVGPISNMRQAKKEALLVLQESDEVLELRRRIAAMEQQYESLLEELSDARADTPLVIDDILVTDPDLAAPITEPAVGISMACGVCGQLFTGPGLFCAQHV